MNATVQAVLVFAIVACAVAYATLKFMPAAWRRSVAVTAATAASRIGLNDAQVRRVEAKLATGGACGSCDSCKACASPAEPPPGAYRRIPIRPA